MLLSARALSAELGIWRNCFGLRAYGILVGYRLDPLAFLDAAEAVRLGGRAVNDAVAWAMKPKPLSALSHFTVPSMLLSPAGTISGIRVRESRCNAKDVL